MNRFIVCDTNLCIGCRTCEVSCIVAHSLSGRADEMTRKDFYPRLAVIKSDVLSAAVMCKHCEDAPCVKVCPTAALIQESDSIQVVQDKCIGCKSCELACPFGAISIEKGADNELQILKCDLCKNREVAQGAKGPACVEFCPTGALSIFQPEQMKKLREKRQRETLIK